MDQHRAASVLSRPASFSMNTYQQLPQKIQQLPDRQSLEESLKRSITLVFWYKPLCEPIRLNQEISTFPLFQLSQFSQLVSDLGVNPSGYVDSYNPYSGHWEQQAIITVRAVESEQRLLYRIRKSFLEGLTEDDCPGLRDEVALQMRPAVNHTHTSLYTSPIPATPTAVKRSAPDSTENTMNKYYRMDHAGNAGQAYVNSNSVLQYTSTTIPTQPYPTPPSYPETLSSSKQVSSPTSTFSYTTTAKEPTTPSPSISPSTVSFPYHPHPPLKRWPNDYTVSEVASGFKQMDYMIAQQPTLTQRIAFERVFGCRYVKSTVCRHRGVWRRADEGVKSTFEGMGADERAVWGDFVKQVEGRRKPDSQSASVRIMANDIQYQASGMQIIPGRMGSGSRSAGDGSPASGGDEVGSASAVDLDEPVMASLGPPPLSSRIHQSPCCSSFGVRGADAPSETHPEDSQQQQPLDSLAHCRIAQGDQ